MIGELNFEVALERETNRSIMPSVLHHLKRQGFPVREKQGRLIIEEPAMKDFQDFCQDHMDASSVWFRLRNQEWRPLSVLDQVWESEWIDEVIDKQLLTCHSQPIVTPERAVYAYYPLSAKTDCLFQREPQSVFLRGKREENKRKKEEMGANISDLFFITNK